MNARRGGILLETLVSIALFVGAGAFALAAARNATTALDRTQREQMALDLARSTLSELEAGILSIQDVRDGERTQIGSLVDWAPSGSYDSGPLDTRWVFDIESEPTEYRGLSLVTLTVSEESAGGDLSSSVTLRQLMRLREERTEGFREDDMLDLIP